MRSSAAVSGVAATEPISLVPIDIDNGLSSRVPRSVRSTPRTPLQEFPQEPFPTQLLPAAEIERSTLDPRTPPPTYKFDPHSVSFCNLMPVFSSAEPDYPPLNAEFESPTTPRPL